MSRSVPEWRGKKDDTDPPAGVKARVLRRYGFACWRCGRKIVSGRPWQCDHMLALINGGENRESNLGPLCEFCIPPKNAADVAIKAKSDDVTKAAYNIKPKSGRRLGSDRYRRRMDGKVVDRRTGEIVGGNRE